jgi:hypothetical protein
MNFKKYKKWIRRKSENAVRRAEKCSKGQYILVIVRYIIPSPPQKELSLSTSLRPQHQIEVSGQLHDAASLGPVPTEETVEWVPQPV